MSSSNALVLSAGILCSDRLHALYQSILPLSPGLVENPDADIARHHERIQAWQQPVLVWFRIVSVICQYLQGLERDPFPLLGLLYLLPALSLRGGVVLRFEVRDVFVEVDGSIIVSDARAKQVLFGREGFELTTRDTRLKSCKLIARALTYLMRSRISAMMSDRQPPALLPQLLAASGHRPRGVIQSKQSSGLSHDYLRAILSTAAKGRERCAVSLPQEFQRTSDGEGRCDGSAEWRDTPLPQDL